MKKTPSFNVDGKKENALKSNFKNLLAPLLLLLTLIFSHDTVQAQSMGISSSAITPDSSSILEIRTTTKGLLIPRMTTAQRDAINLPADGLMIYNTTTQHFNFYDGSGWDILRSGAATGLRSTDAGTLDTTVSITDTVVAGMTLTPGAGTYIVHFNGQGTIAVANDTTGFSTATAVADLNLVYTDIMAIPVTNSTHPLVFGSSEVLPPGVYDIAGAASIAGTLTLDGGGDTNALFVIRATGAFNTGAGVNVVLANGTMAKNIFWVAQGAIGLGANTTIQGTLFSAAAVAAGAGCTVTGRLLTTSGAIACGPGTLSLPSGSSPINFRSLTPFIMFTSSGAVANTGASTYTGDIGTDLGAITGFEAAGCVVNGTIFPAGASTVVTPIYHEATFSLYQNGVLIPNSDRTFTNSSVISLQGIATVQTGETIEVRWKMDAQNPNVGQIVIGKRILSLTDVN